MLPAGQPNNGGTMRRLIYLCLICVPLACSQSEEPESSQVEVEVTERVVVRNDSLNPEPILYAGRVETDAAGRIFVADRFANNVKVYDASGGHIRTFGEEGSGPGEFEMMRGFAVMHDSIFVYDQSLKRLNIFSRDGELLDNHPLKGVPGALEMQELGSGYLFTFQDSPYAYDTLHYAHEYDREFNHRADFIEQSEIAEGLGGGTDHLGVQQGSVLILGPDRLLYSPWIYAGRLYMYERNARGDWSLASSHMGYTEKPPHSEIENENNRAADMRSLTVEGGQSYHILHNRSRGLFRYDGHIYHFTFIEIGEERVFGVEIYDSGMNLLAYKRLEAIPISTEENNTIYRFVDDVDAEGNFYERRLYPDANSEIRVLNFTIEGH